ncbi:hypothetical protein [Bacillus cereus]|uniref:hypothetical protein n=1 Tax=Bacillus cereus TaxID=1396 RepID=UPI00032E927B|nr:hypothetical protein [Bacillus cereus]EOO44173.1 hypothetical protein ICK_06430 [Bacillus cereus BAG1X2-2]EOP00428.1 hypothetical protein ICO_06384 [Bacillus cereus BAG2O-1]
MARKIKKEVFLTTDGTQVYVDEFSVKRLMQMVTRADIVNMSTNVTKEGVWFTYSTSYSHGSMFLSNLGK